MNSKCTSCNRFQHGTPHEDHEAPRVTAATVPEPSDGCKHCDNRTLCFASSHRARCSQCCSKSKSLFWTKEFNDLLSAARIVCVLALPQQAQHCVQQVRADLTAFFFFSPQGISPNSWSVSVHSEKPKGFETVSLELLLVFTHSVGLWV